MQKAMSRIEKDLNSELKFSTVHSSGHPSINKVRLDYFTCLNGSVFIILIISIDWSDDDFSDPVRITAGPSSSIVPPSWGKRRYTTVRWRRSCRGTAQHLPANMNLSMKQTVKRVRHLFLWGTLHFYSRMVLIILVCLWWLLCVTELSHCDVTYM